MTTSSCQDDWFQCVRTIPWNSARWMMASTSQASALPTARHKTPPMHWSRTWELALSFVMTTTCDSPVTVRLATAWSSASPCKFCLLTRWPSRSGHRTTQTTWSWYACVANMKYSVHNLVIIILIQWNTKFASVGHCCLFSATSILTYWRRSRFLRRKESLTSLKSSSNLRNPIDVQ